MRRAPAAVVARLRPLGAAALVAAALAAAGCGLGAGGSTRGAVALSVTRDFGAHDLGQVSLHRVPASESALRLLESNFKVTTRYGGAFVQSIDGLSAGHVGGRPFDWFYYVNGMQATVGASQVKVHAGDRIWWDRHDWGETMTVPAVVGSFPEPFAHGSGGRRTPLVLQCADDARAACDIVSRRLSDAGVVASRAGLEAVTGADTLRILVGPYSELGHASVAKLIARGPAASGVYVRVDPSGRTISLLDQRGRVARRLGAGDGLIAASRFESQDVAWLVTGPDLAGVRAAAQHLDARDLRHHFALAVAGGRPVAVPVVRP